MQALDRIGADFGRLGLHGPGHEDEIDLGIATSANLAGHELREGEQVIVYEEGSLEAPATLFSKQDVEGRRYWVARIDRAAMRHLDEDELGEGDLSEDELDEFEMDEDVSGKCLGGYDIVSPCQRERRPCA
jgi:hypothetical protein